MTGAARPFHVVLAPPPVPPPPQPSRWLHTDEVARIFNVSPKTVSRWAKDGRLPHQRTLGGHSRYDPAVIDRLAAELTVGARIHGGSR